MGTFNTRCIDVIQVSSRIELQVWTNRNPPERSLEGEEKDDEHELKNCLADNAVICPQCGKITRKTLEKIDCTQTLHLPKSYNAFLLPWCQFSQINPAIVRPLPTPAPSPMKNPALLPFWRCWRCLCHQNQIILLMMKHEQEESHNLSSQNNLTSINQCLNLQAWQCF